VRPLLGARAVAGGQQVGGRVILLRGERGVGARGLGRGWGQGSGEPLRSLSLWHALRLATLSAAWSALRPGGAGYKSWRGAWKGSARSQRGTRSTPPGSSDATHPRLTRQMRQTGTSAEAADLRSSAAAAGAATGLRGCPLPPGGAAPTTGPGASHPSSSVWRSEDATSSAMSGGASPPGLRGMARARTPIHALGCSPDGWRSPDRWIFTSLYEEKPRWAGEASLRLVG
jgi:hypothetical protein